MKDIKTKDTIKDIKVLDKTQAGTAHAKETFIRSKNQAQNQADETQSPEHDSPTEYATSKTSEGTTAAAAFTADKAKKAPKKAAENVRNAKQNFQEVKSLSKEERQKAANEAQKTAQQAKQKAEFAKSKAENAKQAVTESRKTLQEAKRNVQEVKKTGQQTVKSARQAEKTIKQSAKTTGNSVKQSAKTVKATGKGTVKTAQKSVKTAEKSAKAAVKTAKQTVKTAQATAKSTAKAAKVAAQTARVTAKAAVAATKVAVKAVAAAIKAIIAAVKGLVALIAAGGWVAVLIIIIICIVGAIVGSVFGIFFSGEKTTDGGAIGRTMPDVVGELTTEFYGKADEIIAANEHDVLDMGIMSINWSEALAVYAVKINTDPNNPAEVVTLNDDKIGKLRDILNDMVSLSHSLQTSEQEQTVTDEDGKETTETVEITTLTIRLEHKTAEEMAVQYGFSQTQTEQMRLLLSPEYADLWAALLGGYAGGSGEIGVPDGSRIPTGIFTYPIGEGHNITSLFGYRRDPFSGETKYHGGVDIEAPAGTPILAAADGVVVVANATDSWGGGWGYYVKIQHNEEFSTLYAHCSQIAVTNGQEVKQGEVIGYVGTTGQSTGNHLHWEVYQNGARVDPLGWFE